MKLMRSIQTFCNLSRVDQLVEELVSKWRSFPETQHTPLCAHLLGLAMKTVTQLALGERFGDDAEVISFRKNHDAVRRKGFKFCNCKSIRNVRDLTEQ